ncbi:unnamed protein product [Musa acuminata subsp. malaccensis]|uniref:(wild Malaysian banana) hypothetical protein n=1 Tax=Musa acuminata subsp. malaccensis TaxID=214687 RepID=A0A804JLT2_MUSAM|nr:PREDICTED: uncharacterized protein LOC103989255 [Musa acuminata subsp. malaccensis]CAG1847763.1 unnamed protein product [Musa acuminata subsp. malaccensis]
MKLKGKIHPSPAAQLPAAGSPQQHQSHDALAVLSLLPAAILALTAAMGKEDREVLAYLLTRSIEGWAEDRRHCQRPGRTQHRPVFGCGCFDCYTGFWSRWDCSPDRELIHQAIEAFEEHLASSESKGGASARVRRRERKAAQRADKGKKIKGKETDMARRKPEEVEKDAALTMVGEAESVSDEEAPVSETAEEDEGAETGSGERRRGWADVIGVFNSRLWSLWSPGA